MSGGGGSPKVATYDPSAKEAEFSMMKTDLTDRVTKQAYGLQQNANVYRDMALESLNDGLGLLSTYLDNQSQQEYRMGELASENLNTGMDLHTRARAGADFVMGSTMEYLKQADKMDRYKRNARGGNT